MWTYTTDSMDFVTVSTGLILPYWMGLPIRYIHSGYVSYIRQNDKASEQITEYICKNLSGLDWTHDRGTLTTEFYPLHVVDEQKIPAILFEAGFNSFSFI